MTPASAGHVDVDGILERELVERAARGRAFERALGKRLAPVLRWVLIVGIPCGCALALLFPSGGRPFGCRSEQSESKGNLKALYVAEESYRAEYDRYSDDAGAMGYQPRGAQIRYRYLVHSDATHFVAYAVGQRDRVRGDVWRIDDGNNSVNLVNRCE